MRALAYSNADALNARINALKLTPDYELIRAPECGLMQLQARMGGTGNRFFAGDTTLTRAVVRLKSGTLGYSYLLGRNKQHAEQCAVIDALLQEQTHFQSLMETLIAPLEAERDLVPATESVTDKISSSIATMSVATFKDSYNSL